MLPHENYYGGEACQAGGRSVEGLGGNLRDAHCCCLHVRSLMVVCSASCCVVAWRGRRRGRGKAPGQTARFPAARLLPPPCILRLAADAERAGQRGRGRGRGGGKVSRLPKREGGAVAAEAHGSRNLKNDGCRGRRRPGQRRQWVCGGGKCRRQCAHAGSTSCRCSPWAMGCPGRCVVLGGWLAGWLGSCRGLEPLP